MEFIRKHIEEISLISDSDWEYFSSKLVLRVFKKHTVFLKYGIESCAEEMTRMQGRRCTEYFIEQELERGGLSRERVHADGNCLFRAVALAVCGDERQYTTVKRLSAYKMFQEVED